MNVEFVNSVGFPVPLETVAKANDSNTHIYELGATLSRPFDSQIFVPGRYDHVQLRDGKWFEVSHVKFALKGQTVVLFVNELNRSTIEGLNV